MPDAKILGIHHIRFPVRDLERSLAFYERVFGAERVAAADHVHGNGTRYAMILDVPDLGTYLELRLNPAQAPRQRMFDPVTIAVEDRQALQAWSERLDGLGIDPSPVLVALQTWLLLFRDPDERVLLPRMADRFRWPTPESSRDRRGAMMARGRRSSVRTCDCPSNLRLPAP